MKKAKVPFWESDKNPITGYYIEPIEESIKSSIKKYYSQTIKNKL